MIDQDQNLADSIAMLEQILEVMPQDTDALKALYTAHFKNHSIDRSFEYLGRMLNVAAGSGDALLFEYIQNELPKFESTHSAEVAAQLSRIRTLFGVHRINQGISRAARKAESEQVGNLQDEADIAEELAFAWKLYEENQFSQDEYSSVLHDLTEVSSKELDVPVSVMHVLNDRGFLNSTRILNHVSLRSGVPYISIGNFEINERAAKALPLSYSKHDGLLPFGFVGNDLLVAVLNPFHHALIDNAEKESGHRCHTFLVDSADYDEALSRLRAIVEVSAA
jgi:tetratricopeptide (TPR) repeat protein